jgi:hypothetical protein
MMPELRLVRILCSKNYDFHSKRFGTRIKNLADCVAQNAPGDVPLTTDCGRGQSKRPPWPKAALAASEELCASEKKIQISSTFLRASGLPKSR